MRILIVVLLLSVISYSRDYEEFPKKTVVGKTRGIEVLNFYEEVPEQNSIKHYGRYEYNDDYSLIEWKLAEGYLSLNEEWDFEYDIEREFYFDRDLGGGERNLTGWDNLMGFVKNMGSYEAFNREWNRDLGFMWEYDQLDIPSRAGGNYDKSEVALRYRVRTNADIGRGGTYWGFDFWGAKVFTTGKNGYSLEANLISATNWGYGFQTFNTLYNEYYDYGGYNGTYLLGLESYTRWTHELSRYWAFTVEAGVDTDKYSGGTAADYTLELTLYPYLLYNREVLPELRIFGELGLPGYRYAKIRDEFQSDSTSGIYLVALVGIQYIW